MNKFFKYTRKCAILLEIYDADEQAKLLNDPSWFFCFDDGLTPEEAVEEFKLNRGKTVNGYVTVQFD